LSQAGYVDATLPLNLIKYMSREMDYLPWNSLVNNRAQFYINMLETTEHFGEFKTYMVKLIDPYYKKLGWNENDEKFEWVDR
jgi:hypothetical protein